jgi:tripartite-type tricarboxylate transporter receptor subunit TctC
LLLVPYRGAAPGITDMIGGQVDLMIAQGAVTLPQVRAGALKAIVNMSPQRSPSIPEIPTSDEAGVPGLYVSGWFGLYAPKGTPADIVGKLDAAMVQALADPVVRTRFAELGLDVAAREQQTPEALAKFTKAEIDKWWPIIRASGIRGE